MGSVDAACKTGFICRLCSDMHRVVIHVYGNKGLEMKLADKINEYLPVTISPKDPLPKTICMPCMRQLESTYKLITQLRVVRNLKHKENVIPSATAETCILPHSTGPSNSEGGPIITPIIIDTSSSDVEA